MYLPHSTQLSIDGGVTWTDMKSDARIIFRDASEDDDSMQDLHLVVTSEGVILDLVNQSSGDVEKTASLLMDDLLELTH